MRILVMGGTGFVGSRAVKLLAEEGHEVTVFHRGRTDADLPAGVGRILGDRERLGDSAREFGRFSPEVVVDVSPMLEGHARALMEALGGLAGRVVAVSSGDVYRAYGRLTGSEPGPPDPVPLTEDAPLREKLYPYRGEQPRSADDPMSWVDDYEKILVERAVMGDPGLPGTVLRFPAVYGPGDAQRRIFPYLKRMDDGRSSIPLGEGMARWRWTRGYVENVAAAVALAATDERAAGRVYNVGEAEAPTEAAWVKALGEVAGWDGEVVPVPEDRLPAHLSMGLDTSQHIVTDTSRIREELGYEERVPREEALRLSIRWERENPPEGVDPGAFDYAAEDAALRAP